MPSYLLPLVERKEVAEGTMAFYFEKDGYIFKAGQHTGFTLINPPETDEEGNARDFSISSSPNEPYLMITTRMRNTAFKRVLKSLPFGTKIRVGPPVGSMVLPQDASKPLVLLAGGIGITPFRSIVAYATEEKLPHRIYLFYSNRTPGLTAFLSDLERFEKENPNFRLIATVTDSQDPAWKHERGRINAEMLKKHVPGLGQPRYFVAGPPEMVVGMLQMLSSAGLDEATIKTEEFAGY